MAGADDSFAGDDSPTLSGAGASPRDGVALGAGDCVGPYEVIRPLGAGAMGVVYLSRDRRLGRRVALKFLRGRGELTVTRLLHEAQATARLVHENVVTLYGLEWHQGRPYLALEYVQGDTLESWMTSPAAPRPASAAQVIELLRPVVRALAAAHAVGIVHRDLKPSNIMLATTGPSRCSTSASRGCSALRSRRASRSRPRRPRAVERRLARLWGLAPTWRLSSGSASRSRPRPTFGRWA
jgi:serine/threonine protein kinase